MNKADIYKAFDGKISNNTIQRIDGEYLVTGKYCRIGLDGDGQIDVFICNHKDLTKGLGTRVVGNRLSAIFGSDTSLYTELTGEAWGKVSDKEIILGNLKLLGIRKKRVMSPEQASKNAEVLNLARRKIQIDNHLGAT